MILAVDHIACCGPDVPALVASFHQAGFATDVVERDLVNLDIKKKLMETWSPVHDLVLLRKAGAVSVEVLDHRGVGTGVGYLTLEDSGVFCCRTADLEGSAEFWRALGFRKGHDGSLVFRSAFSPSLGIDLRQDAGRCRPMLDDVGFNAVALLSSSVAADREALSCLCEVTEIRQLAVGGRPLELFFARNRSGGELVEVFGLGRGGEK